MTIRESSPSTVPTWQPPCDLSRTAAGLPPRVPDSGESDSPLSGRPTPAESTRRRGAESGSGRAASCRPGSVGRCGRQCDDRRGAIGSARIVSGSCRHRLSPADPAQLAIPRDQSAALAEARQRVGAVLLLTAPAHPAGLPQTPGVAHPAAHPPPTDRMAAVAAQPIGAGQTGRVALGAAPFGSHQPALPIRSSCSAAR